MKPSSGNSLDARFLRDLVNTVWPTIGVSLEEEYSDRLSQRRFGDGVIVNTLEGKRHIDWKASQVAYASFPVELLQDWQSLDVGWYYTLQCDQIFFGHYVAELATALAREPDVELALFTVNRRFSFSSICEWMRFCTRSGRRISLKRC